MSFTSSAAVLRARVLQVLTPRRPDARLLHHQERRLCRRGGRGRCVTMLRQEARLPTSRGGVRPVAARSREQVLHGGQWVVGEQCRQGWLPPLARVHTYNTAMAACLDDMVKSIYVGPRLRQTCWRTPRRRSPPASRAFGVYLCTKVLVWQLMKQLLGNWWSWDVDKHCPLPN